MPNLVHYLHEDFSPISIYFLTRYKWRCQRARTDWDWPSSAGLCICNW